MYGYSEFVPLEEAEIFKRVSQDEIIEMALGYKPVPYQRICNPLKKHDRNPGAYFEWFGGKLWFVDFGDFPTHRVVFKFISDFYKIPFIDGLKLVNNHFKLGLGQNDEITVPKPVIYEHTSQHHNKEKERSHIIYKQRPLSAKDKSYWFSRYGITRENLAEDEVLAALWYKVYSNIHQRWIVNRPRDICYVYTEFKQHVKVYRPFADRKHKWVTNCDENDIGGLRLLNPIGRTLIVKKAYKDYRIIKNQGLNSIWFQNEGCVPSPEILADLSLRFDKIYVWFDNDEAGIKNSIKVSELININSPNKAIPIWLPENLREEGIKDPSDLYFKKSEKHLKEFINEKDLYGTTQNHPSHMDSSSSSPF